MMSERGILAAFTPIGVLRASISLGNPILANNDPRTREPFGVSVDLAGAFAQRLGVALELVVFDSSRQVGAGGHGRTGPTSASSLSIHCGARASRSPRLMC